MSESGIREESQSTIPFFFAEGDDEEEPLSSSDSAHFEHMLLFGGGKSFFTCGEATQVNKWCNQFHRDLAKIEKIR